MAAAKNCPQEHHLIAGANHYYFGQPAQCNQAAQLVKDWVDRQG